MPPVYGSIFSRTQSINVPVLGGGWGFILIVTSFFRGVILFVTECDTGGGGGPKMVTECLSQYLKQGEKRVGNVARMCQEQKFKSAIQKYFFFLFTDVILF